MEYTLNDKKPSSLEHCSETSKMTLFPREVLPLSSISLISCPRSNCENNSPKDTGVRFWGYRFRIAFEYEN